MQRKIIELNMPHISSP